MKKKIILPQKSYVNTLKNDDNFIYSVPFYGKKGTLKSVKLDDIDDNYYVVTRYSISGADGDVFPVPKKRRKELQKEYIKDVKNYLDYARTKYLTILHNSHSLDPLKKQKLILAIVTVLVTAMSLIGSVLATDGMLYFFLTCFFAGFISTCFEFKSLRNLVINEKRYNEKKEYEKYMSIYNDYNIKRDRAKKYRPTMYSNLEQSDNKVVDINKKKVLEKSA